MRRLVLLGIIILWGVANGSWGSVNQSVTLRSDGIISRDQIFLSDFFQGIPPERDQAILRAPDFGAKITYQSPWIGQLAHNFGLTWTPGDKTSITFTRDAHIISRDDLTQKLKDHYHRAHPSDHDIDITLDTKDVSWFMDPQQSDVRLESIDWGGKSGRFKAQLVLSQDKMIGLHGRVTHIHMVPVLKRAIEVGDAITEQDIAWKKIPVTSSGLSWVMSTHDMIGFGPKARTLVPDEPVRKQDLQKPFAIRKGIVVTIKVEMGNIVAAALGKSMDNGAVGDTIRVQNNDTKKIIMGVVRDSNTVMITPMNPMAGVSGHQAVNLSQNDNRSKP